VNAGLSSLTKLKAAILPDSMRANAMWDDTLIALGLGVADAIESYLDRKLGWMVDDVTEYDAERVVVGVPRYPVLAFTAVELQSTPGATWESIGGSVMRFMPKAGLISFQHSPANEFGTIRVTSTGGFWWDESEEADGTMPEGATPLPGALFTAWAMQVQAHCNALDLFGAQAGKDTLGSSSNLLTNADAFIPAVESMLKSFRRFAA
jgi:hypothetical protein